VQQGIIADLQSAATNATVTVKETVVTAILATLKKIADSEHLKSNPQGTSAQGASGTDPRYVLGFYKIYGKFTYQILSISYGYYLMRKHDTSDNFLY
jgi:hypothetical protein